MTKAIFFSILIFGLAETTLAQDSSDSPSPRFVTSKNTVLDTKTGLAWQRCSVGMTWKPENRCTGTAKKFTYVEAQKLNRSHWPEGLWRVPTKNELETLIDLSQSGMKADPAVFPDVSKENRFFWTMDLFNDGSAWYADFLNGFVDHVSGDYDFLTRKWNVRMVHVER